jgi:hypothetical protein
MALKPEVEVSRLAAFPNTLWQGEAMAGPAPKTRNWRALENAHKPKGLHVLVFGEVDVSAANMEPRLTESAERNPRNLGLTLTMEKSGDGPDIRCSKAVRFHKEVAANQFDNVIVRWDVQQIASVPVHDDRERVAQAAAAMKALNQQYAGKAKPAKPVARKPAAQEAAPTRPAAKKKSAPKKKAARSVGGWARGKKVKKAKKAPKKAAKKSGFKKLVRKLVKKLTPGKKR